MLRRVGGDMDSSGARAAIGDAKFPAPFQEGLEYSSPARGTWNIVHTGMLIPESHQIFVCAQGCLRGVVLTAAEMNAMGRYSAVAIREENVLDGTMEELMIEGVSDVLQKLSYRPKAVLLFISCQHFFLAYDQKGVFRTLRKRFPDIRFLDCYMIPTLRKSGLTPDQKMRIQLYSALEPLEQNPKKINLIGSNLPVSENSELVKLIRENGFELVQLQDCQSFDDYLHMAESHLNIFYEPLALMAAKDLEKRLGQKYLYLTFSFRFEELEENYRKLCEVLKIPLPDDWSSRHRERAELSLKQARDMIGSTPIAVDCSFTFRIMSFTRMLLEHGFHVTEIYGDVFLPEEKEDFLWIQKHYPKITITSCIRPKLRYLKRERDEKTLAIGQKAAYFTGTDHFVNVVESGGLYGYEGIVRIAELMQDAFLHTKDRRSIIQRKGYGCESCI